MTQSSPPHYPPFGSSLPIRTWSDGNRGYRFGFNGKEKDSETASDNFDFGARIYDGRLGRWLSLDPLMKKAIYNSPYSYCANSPIFFIDVNGKILKPSNDEDMSILMATISETEREYLRLTPEGVIDVALMYSYLTSKPASEVSQNFQSMLTIARSTDVYNFTQAVGHIVKIGDECFIDELNLETNESSDCKDQAGTAGENFIGKVDPEKPELPISADEEYWIIVNSDLNTFQKKVENAAHELGHAYLYEKRKLGENVSPYHEFNPIIFVFSKDKDCNGNDIIIRKNKDMNRRLNDTLRRAVKEVKEIFKKEKNESN
jgi:RHS repeat-associated protein